MREQRSASRVDGTREATIGNYAPPEVIEAALSVFDVLRPGVEVLSVLEDSRNIEGDGDGSDGFVVRFGNVTTAVAMTVMPLRDLLRIAVSLQPEEDAIVRLEQLAPRKTLVPQGSAPAVFEGVARGFVSILGFRSLQLVWCTSWTRL